MRIYRWTRTRDPLGTLGIDHGKLGTKVTKSSSRLTLHGVHLKRAGAAEVLADMGGVPPASVCSGPTRRGPCRVLIVLSRCRAGPTRGERPHLLSTVAPVIASAV